jgi:hypothetical protein
MHSQQNIKVINIHAAQKILNGSVLRQYPIHGAPGTNDIDIMQYGNQGQEAGFKSL